MKKIVLLFIAAIVATNLAHAQSDWANYRIDDKLSVKVPATPTKSDDYSVMAQSNDTVTVVISIIDLQKVAGIDSVAVAGMATTDDFKNGIKNGMVGKMPGFTLGDVKTNKWNGYYCYTIDGNNPEKKLNTYTFMVIMGNTLYSLTALLPDNKNPKVKDDFFASLTRN